MAYAVRFGLKISVRDSTLDAFRSSSVGTTPTTWTGALPPTPSDRAPPRGAPSRRPAMVKVPHPGRARNDPAATFETSPTGDHFGRPVCIRLRGGRARPQPAHAPTAPAYYSGAAEPDPPRARARDEPSTAELAQAHALAAMIGSRKLTGRDGRAKPELLAVVGEIGRADAVRTSMLTGSAGTAVRSSALSHSSSLTW